MDLNHFRETFFQRVASPMVAEMLFDHLDTLTFFIKDDQARYVSVNQTLADRCGAKNKNSLIGRTSAEVYPVGLGSHFMAQDLELIRTGQPLLSEIEQHPYPRRSTGWCITTKLPLHDRDENVIGLVGMSRDLQSPDDEPDAYASLAKVIEHVKRHLDNPCTTGELAELAELSAWQLDQRIRELFGMTTAQLVLQFRMDTAAKRLKISKETLISIAMAVGYGDQSAFTRQFRKTFGMTPGEYRRDARS